MAKNERGAGRKRKLSEATLIVIKKRHEEGETITALAQEYGISRQALSQRIHSKEEGNDIICHTLVQWKKQNRDFQTEYMDQYRMRMEDPLRNQASKYQYMFISQDTPIHYLI